MTWEQALAPSLEQTLNLILSALANFFGTTTQAIMANAPEWLAKYGWYVTLHNELIEWVLGGAFAGALLVAGFLAIWCFTDHEVKPPADWNLYFLILPRFRCYYVHPHRHLYDSSRDRWIGSGN